jgi:hypothetical protein
MLRLLFSATVLAVMSLPAVALADARPDPAQDPEVARLLEAKGATLKWNHVPAGKSVRYGHAEVLVDAPLAKVKKAAVDFAHYKEFHHKFASARVVAKEGDTTDVYLKLPIKLGPVKLDQWEVMRFGPARTTASNVVVEGRGVQGSMKEGHLVITARALDEKHCLVKVDLLLLPSMPAPQSMIDEELRDAATDFVNGVRDKSQGDNHIVTSL